MKRSFLWALIMVLTSIGYAQAQTTVTGTVFDDNNETIPNAYVLVKGTNIGTYADDNGKYSITVPADATNLVFKSESFKDLDVVINGRTVIDAHMQTDIQTLGAATVVANRGYGQIGEGTGAVGAVKPKDLDQVPITNLTQMLQGKSTGLQATAASGRPGAAANITIRGVGSITAGTEPLYVIDGVQTTASDFSALNANDVENVTVLKDAAATSIYGSRGANGVILVTTKSGRRSEDTRIEFRTMQGFSFRTNGKYEIMDSREKLLYERDVLGAGKGVGMSDDQLNAFAKQYNTDWVDEVFRTGHMQSYEVNINGGSEKTSVYFSGQYLKNKAIVFGSELQRFSGRLNVSHQVKDWLKFTNNLSAGYTKETTVRDDLDNVQSPFNYALMTVPYTYPYNPDGSFHEDGDLMDYGLNIFEQIVNGPSWVKNTRVLNTTALNFKIREDLNFTSTFTVRYATGISYSYEKPESRLSQILGTPGNRVETHEHLVSYTWTNVANYKKIFANKHSVEFLLGQEIQKTESRSLSGQKQNYISGNYDNIGAGSLPVGVGGGLNENAFASFFGRGSYIYDNRYSLEASLRYDGSSRFGDDNRWGTFWAVGGAWHISREKFMEGATNILNLLKLRASYGTAGNYNIGNYEWRSAYSTGSYNGGSYLSFARYKNKKLTWEKQNMVSVGLDWGLLENRISGSVDWYDRRTTDALLNVPVAPSIGLTSELRNIGEIQNTGVEISISGDVVKTKDWYVSLGASYTYNKNKVKKLYNGEDIISGLNIIKEGLPLYTFYLTRYAGVNPTNGDALYYTEDGSVTNEFNTYNVPMDKKSPNPTYFGSFTLNASYKQFELSAELYYSGGNYLFNRTRYFLESDGRDGAKKNQSPVLLYDSWKQPGDITDIPRQTTTATPAFQTDRWLERGDYARLRNVTLSYRFSDTNWLKKANINSIRVYAQAQNILTFTKYKGVDPEVNGVSESFNYPVPRIFTFGLDISF